MYLPDGAELWRPLERLAAASDQPCAVSDAEGRPWIYQPVHADDVAHALVCALESPNAIGEAFNVAAPLPIEFPHASALLAEANGQSPLVWRCPVRWVFDLDNKKAKAMIGFAPKWGIEAMIAAAAAMRRGEWEHVPECA